MKSIFIISKLSRSELTQLEGSQNAAATFSGTPDRGCFLEPSLQPSKTLISDSVSDIADLLSLLTESGEVCLLVITAENSTLIYLIGDTDGDPDIYAELLGLISDTDTEDSLPDADDTDICANEESDGGPIATTQQDGAVDTPIEDCGDTEPEPTENPVKKSLASSIFDWFEVLCVALVCVLCIVTFVVRQSPVEGSSMYPTLIGHSAGSSDPEHGLDKGGDVLLISNLFYSPKRSDIVVIQEPTQLTEPIVKRIIALGGDTVKINFTTWEVYVNGELLEEDYVNKKESSLSAQHLRVDENNCWEGEVPKGHIFVLGDNRSVSKDSRTFGYIDERYIIGKVILRISPLSRFGTVDE